MSKDYKEPLPVSPVQPVALGLEEKFRFRCHQGIACFNRCCESIDILLMPYDIVRLKNRLDVSSREFIDRYTRDSELDAHGMPGLKLAKKPGTSACVFLTAEGCGVYEDRPSACRYYALGLMAMKKKDTDVEEDAYFVVKEAHCLGHEEAHTQTVGEYRREQGVDVYDEKNRDWRRIILKKRSSGPAVGRPSQRSFELFFLASYDIDGFRAFVASEGFRRVFELDEGYYAKLLADEDELLAFAHRYLRQVLYGEQSIALRADEAARRAAIYQAKLAARATQSGEDKARQQDEFYESLLDDDQPGERGE
ncbi:MAG: YkgJ family cysteine cluster protein [Betaproteobacteria bacterium]|nr:YkgJ family cysteine cluster protein [Betaproteobacteria bacterium]